MENTVKIKENGCGNAVMDRNHLEKAAFCAIMELPKESWERILMKYFEKYGMEEAV